MRLTAAERLGHYEIHALLGAGGMGEVYRATDTRLGREVALKVLPAAMATDPDRLMRFHREARSAAGLNHPNIVTLYSAEEIDGIHFFTMELVDGRPLDELIPAEGFTAERVVELAIPLAEAIAAAHDKGLVHRDLKPANILINTEGLLKIVDFGLAAAMSHSNSRVTKTGHMVGTPSYMAPEQVRGLAIDQRTDLYALGVIMYEMFTGVPPYAADNPMAVLYQHLEGAKVPPRQRNAEISPALEGIILKAMAVNPDERHASAADMLAAVEQLMMKEAA